MPPPRSTWRAQRSRTKPIGADFGRLGTALRFISRSMSIARISAAAAGTPWKTKAIEESRSPTTDASIVFTEHLVGIKLFRPRQRPGLRDGREEAVPGDYRGDRVKGVLLVVARRNQSGADAGVKADLLVDGAAIGLEGAGMPLVGFAEHRPDQPVEQIDCLIRQAGGEIEGDGDQVGMPALALVTRDMLHRGAARFPGELGKAGLMHTMPARRIKAGCADMVQT